MTLSEADVHLWQGSISQIVSLVNPAQLSEAEIAKAAKLKNPQMQTQFLAAHWMTRLVLSKYLQTVPTEIGIFQSATGKPDIDGTRIKFNRSHSGDRIVLAITLGTPVGVDIEAIANRSQMAGIVKRWFEPQEQEEFSRSPNSQRQAFFYSRWTEKEAVLKAWGLGLSGLSVYSEKRATSCLQSFTPYEGFAGCVAWASFEEKTVSFYPV